MTVHVAILGIDGSGKSTLTPTLPALLAAELGCRAGSLGDHLQVAAPDHDLAGPGFEPEGVPLSLRLARLLRRLARLATGSRLAYPPLKLGHLACQERAGRRVAARHRLDVLVTDGSLALSAVARAGNYRPGRTNDADPALRRLRGSLPDAVVLLDVAPDEALRRIRGRRRRPDRHENAADLAEARRGYHAALAAYLRVRPSGRALVLPAGELTPCQLAAHVVDFVSPLLQAGPGDAPGPAGPLHRSRAVNGAWPAAARMLNPRYTLGHLLAHARHGAWREPCFLLSAQGRRLLREGYSAAVMRGLYEADRAGAGWAERAFLDYPLHRAVRDRLGILVPALEAELERRLERGRATILTAPSGFADDLLRALARLAARRPELPALATVVAADLDPDGRVAGDLAVRAAALGVALRFHRGDLTGDALRAELAASAPFDLALFVGLSSWLPRPALLRHLRWLRERMAPDGLLVADCFSPAQHAAGGHHMGYRSTYHSPETFAVLLAAGGFDGAGAEVRSGRDGHNHVLLAGLDAAPERSAGAGQAGTQRRTRKPPAAGPASSRPPSSWARSRMPVSPCPAGGPAGGADGAASASSSTVSSAPPSA
jgi:thymidylate kinase